ncbi:MAG: hypothetical protein KC649_07260, partial [Candidatus Omnitrophica bacterium]|nr:hypothetical protein [Candidatus Omnitrophota bacterium]
DDGTFRTANYAKGEPLPAEAVRMIADHLKEWADKYEQLQEDDEEIIDQDDFSEAGDEDFDDEDDYEADGEYRGDDEADSSDDDDDDEWPTEIPDRI